MKSVWCERQLLYAPLGYYWCRQAGVASADAEQIWANVLGRVDRELGDIEHDRRPGAFRKWLRTITRREIMDFQQAQGGPLPAERLIEDLGDQQTNSDSVANPDSVETSILCHRAWELTAEEFSPDQCDVFRRIAERGEQPQNVADSLGLKRASVYATVFRIATRLRERLEGELD